MFTYTISLNADETIFNETCEKVEANVKNIKECESFFDFLDGDAKKVYSVNSYKIIVYNDFSVGAVYVDSEIDLGGFLKSVV